MGDAAQPHRGERADTVRNQVVPTLAGLAAASVAWVALSETAASGAHVWHFSRVIFLALLVATVAVLRGRPLTVYVYGGATFLCVLAGFLTLRPPFAIESEGYSVLLFRPACPARLVALFLLVMSSLAMALAVWRLSPARGAGLRRARAAGGMGSVLPLQPDRPHGSSPS